MRPALLLLLACAPAYAAGPDAAGVEFFEKKVRPILVEQCNKCHGSDPKKVRGGLRLDTPAAIRKGGDSGPAVVPGKPADSLLIKALAHTGDLKMPPKDKLSAGVIADLAKWVQMGAPMPKDDGPAATAGIDWAAARRFWSFQPVKRHEPPVVKNAAWVNNPIDRFILARLEAEGLTPATRADRLTLIRRVTFDLTGLPPTPEEVDAFVADRSVDAYERLVDRLLASPAYGERWARHWLDVARYAEDQAHTFAVKPYTFAWRYRDWVIAALNRDVPYDRFVKLQIAADLMPDAAVEDRPALGFIGLGAQYYKSSNPAKAIAEELDDKVDTLARGFLGLTVACARCHDHKFDPIPIQDYYSLAGVFHSSRMADVTLASKEENDRYQTALKRFQDAEKRFKDFVSAERRLLAEEELPRLADYLVAAWKVRGGAKARETAEAAKLPRDRLDRMVRLLSPTSNQFRNLPALAMWREPANRRKLEEVEKAAKKLQEQVAAQLGKGPLGGKGKNAAAPIVQAFFGDTGVFGVPENALPGRMSGEKKARMGELKAGMEKVRQQMPPAPAVAHGLGEAASADLKVALRGNPLTPGEVAPRRFLRVVAGDDPPKFSKGSGRLELADAIADANNPLTARVIVNRLWLHHFGRGIVGTPSNFGTLGEKPTHPELLDWLASELVRQGWSLKAMHRLILTSATYRLSVGTDAEAGRKDPDNRLLWRANRRRLEVEPWRDALLAVSGRLDATFGGPTTNLGDANNRRRTVYAKVSRHELDGLLRLFDFPDANITSEKRTETTVPQQQLFVLNSPFFLAQAEALARRLEKEEASDAGRVERAYRLLYGRAPADAEMALGQAFLAATDDDKTPRLVRYAQALLAGNEFLFLD